MSEHSRRALLRTAGGLGLAALGTGYGAGVASASVPTSGRFDLTKPAYDQFRGKKLYNATVMQGFAFDDTNGWLFVSQLRDGTSDTSGDLCVTRLSLTGAQHGHMYLKGFGHGVSIAAQPSGSATYLWTEVDANSGGYGKRLARFKFVSGSTLSNTSSSLRKFTPVSGANEHTPAIDPVNKRLIVRYNVSGSGKHIAVHSLAKATDGDFSSPLVKFAQPGISGTPQGYTAYGQYLYYLTGNAYSRHNSSPGNTYLTSVNLNTGKIKQGPVLSKAGSTLNYREPEGLAIHRTSGGEVRLYLGFASEWAGDRRANLFYKKALA